MKSKDFYKDIHEELLLALSIPDAKSLDDIRYHDGFDPWKLFPAFYGSYSSDFDDCAIETLEDVLNGTHKREDLASQMFREYLCTKGYATYGTSPRVCSPDVDRNLLEELLRKWKHYYKIEWGED